MDGKSERHVSATFYAKRRHPFFSFSAARGAKWVNTASAPARLNAMRLCPTPAHLEDRSMAVESSLQPLRG